MPQMLIVLQCSKKKTGRETFGRFQRRPGHLYGKELWTRLNGVRRKMEVRKRGSLKTALGRYTGHFYDDFTKCSLFEGMRSKKIDVIILSGGYGIVHALENIRSYDARMGRGWIKALAEILQNYIEKKNLNEW